MKLLFILMSFSSELQWYLKKHTSENIRCLLLFSNHILVSCKMTLSIYSRIKDNDLHEKQNEVTFALHK